MTHLLRHATVATRRVVCPRRPGINTMHIGRMATTPTLSSAATASPFSTTGRAAADEFEDGPTEAEVRLAVLDAALLHVPEKGWSTEALAFGAESAGYPAMTHGVFTRGPIELVEYVPEIPSLPPFPTTIRTATSPSTTTPTPN